jgi:hypothetical protein
VPLSRIHLAGNGVVIAVTRVPFLVLGGGEEERRWEDGFWTVEGEINGPERATA